MYNTLFGILLGLFIAPLWAGGVAYKCTATNGEISFLDVRPTEGCASIEVVKIAEEAGPTEDTAIDPEAAMAEQNKKEIAEREIKAKEACTKRKSELEILRSRAQVIINDPVSGEKRALSQEEHQEKIRQYEEYIKVLCTETKTPAASTP